MIPVNTFDRAEIIRRIGEAAIAGRKTAVAYLRISSDPRDQRLGVTRQRGDIHTRAGYLRELPEDVEVLVMFEDNDTSGDKDRGADTAWFACEEFLRTYKPAYLLGTTLSRLGRRLGETEELEEHCRKTGLTVWTVDEGDVFEDVLWPVRAGMNKTEILVLRKRLKKAQAARLAVGKDTGGGARPFGYAPDRMTVIPAEARIVRFIARALLLGFSGVQISRHLNGRKVPTTVSGRWVGATVRSIAARPNLNHAVEREIARRVNAGETAAAVARDLAKDCARRELELCDACRAGRPGECVTIVPNPRPSLWSSMMVREVVRKPRVAGLRPAPTGDGQVIRAAWPAILDEATWHRVGRRLAETRSTDGGKTVPGRPTETLLGGVIRCGLCLSPMVGQSSGGGRLTYRCVAAVEDGRRIPGKHVGRQRAALDAYVTERLLAELNVGEVAAELAELEAAVERTEDECLTVQLALAEAGEQWRTRQLRPAEYIGFRDARTVELRQLAAELDKLRAAVDTARRLRSASARWDGWTTAQRREAIKAHFEAIFVYPAVSRGAAARVVREPEIELVPRRALSLAA